MMGTVIPTTISGLEGPVIKDLVFNDETGRMRIVCDRDRRCGPRRYRVDRAKKTILLRHLLLGRVLQFGKARLNRQVPINFQCADSRRRMVSLCLQSANK